jgi:hypothetical protein
MRKMFNLLIGRTQANVATVHDQAATAVEDAKNQVLTASARLEKTIKDMLDHNDTLTRRDGNDTPTVKFKGRT